MSNDWYLEEYKSKDYLHNKNLVYRTLSIAEGEHNHCELCWARFSNHPLDLHSGYYEVMSKSWICDDCYKEAAKLFNWTVR